MTTPEFLFREIDRAVVYGKRAGYVEACRDYFWEECGKRPDEGLERYWAERAEQAFPWPDEEGDK